MVEVHWTLLRSILDRLARGADRAAVSEDDAKLAAFVASHPGRLEARLLQGVATLASSPTPKRASHPTLLAVLLNGSMPPAGTPLGLFHSALASTWEAADPERMLDVFAASRRHREALGPMAVHNSVNLADWFVQRSGADVIDRLDVAPEMRDTLRSRASGETLPDILPTDLTDLDPDAIGRTFAEYCGIPLEELEARMRPGRWSGSGFLAPGERIGEVIHRDAVTLEALGVDRHELAEQLDVVLRATSYNQSAGSPWTPEQIERSRAYYEGVQKRLGERRTWLAECLGEPTGPQGTFELPWTCEIMATCGHQEDPFHSSDVYHLTGRGSSDFTIRDPEGGPDAWFRGPDLITVLVWRAGFFEGTVPYRVDPAHAARVLRLA